MARKVKSFIKKLGHAYMLGVNELYGPMIRYKVSPII